MNNKRSTLKYFSLAIYVVCWAMIFPNLANSLPTKWEVVDSSLSQLLDSGWQLFSHGSNRAAFRNAISPGGFDEETFTFILTKNGKYIMCRVTNPQAPVANLSGCRKLN
jgi:hypothetical protein